MTDLRSKGAALLILAGVGLLAASPSVQAKAKKGPAPLITVSATNGPVAGNEAIATATATCHGKTRAVGGGFLEAPPVVVPFTAEGFVYESRKVGQKSWRASSQLFTSQPTATVTVTSFVYCREGAPKTTARETTATQPGGIAIGPPVTASCSGGQRALAGGFSSPPSFASVNTAPVVLDSARSATQSWSSRLMTRGDASTLTTYAYCAKQKKALPSPTAASAPNSIPGSTSSVTAPCAGKKRPLAGGFSQPQAAAGVPAQLGFFIPWESHRGGRTWRASAVFVGTQPGTLVSTAYCG